jgi:hypothetical protein
MATVPKFVLACTHPDSFSCPKCRPPSMLPSDTKNLDKLMRGNSTRGGTNVVSFANWSYKVRGERR